MRHMDTMAGQPAGSAITQPPQALGAWYYFYFTPPALLVGLAGLNR